MSPFERVTIHTRRGLVALCLVVAIVFPVAAYVVGSTVNDTSTDVTEVQRLAAENEARIDDVARLNRENRQATRALCALRADLRRRVKTSREFLRDHPAGIPGIPAKTIRDGIANQRRTIRALAGLDCRK